MLALRSSLLREFEAEVHKLARSAKRLLVLCSRNKEKAGTRYSSTNLPPMTRQRTACTVSANCSLSREFFDKSTVRMVTFETNRVQRGRAGGSLEKTSYEAPSLHGCRLHGYVGGVAQLYLACRGACGDSVSE